MREPVLCDCREAGASRLVRREYDPQLALRVAILGGIALTLFAVVFFRLWFLQVLSGDRYLAQANDNQERRVTLQAPRGTIRSIDTSASRWSSTERIPHARPPGPAASRSATSRWRRNTPRSTRSAWSMSEKRMGEVRW